MLKANPHRSLKQDYKCIDSPFDASMEPTLALNRMQEIQLLQVPQHDFHYTIE